MARPRCSGELLTATSKIPPLLPFPHSFAALLGHIQDLTGLPMCVHDLSGFTREGGRTVLREDQTLHSSAFCAYVKSTEAGEKACRDCDMTEGNTLAFRAGEPVVRRCHAGLTEVLVPVIRGGHHLGTIFGGQARLSDDGDRVPARMASLGALGLDPRRAASLWRLAPCLSRKDLYKLGGILWLLARHAAEEHERSEFERLAEAERAAPIRSVLPAIRDRLDRSLRLKDIASLAYLSPSRFSHLFSEVMGVSFREYLLRLRIERAQFLLSDTSMPVGEVAFRCGFSDPNHFSRTFHRRTGMSPTAFRRRESAPQGRV